MGKWIKKNTLATTEWLNFASAENANDMDNMSIFSFLDQYSKSAFWTTSGTARLVIVWINTTRQYKLKLNNDDSLEEPLQVLKKVALLSPFP